MRQTTPIEIPESIASDRVIRQLMTSWVHLHARYHICAKRVNWRNARAAEEEKRRRREKWRVVARILEVERTVLRMVAKETRHPDIWMSKKPDAPESYRIHLIRKYHENIRQTHNLRGPDRKTMLTFREKRVAKIRALDRAWMAAIYTTIHPSRTPPIPITLHPRELFPRKLKTASRQLAEEFK